MSSQFSLGASVLIAGSATSTACLFTNPLEVVKTRFQLQGELIESSKLKIKPYKNVFQAFYQIFRHEGIRGIQKGLVPGIMVQFSMNGVRIGSFEPLKNFFGVHTAPKNQQVLRTMAAASLSGILGAFVCSPFQMLKIRFQAASAQFSSIGTQHEYKGIANAVKTIFQTEGLRGFFRGASANMFRIGVGSTIQLTTYDRSKRLILPYTGETVKTHFLASLISGLLLVTVTNPLDVVSTRLYNQQKGAKYSGIIDCARKTFSTEGVRGLYKGWTAHYLRLGPHTVLTFVIWEQYKRIMMGFAK